MNRIIRIAFVIITFLWLLGSMLPVFPITVKSVINTFPFLQIFYSPVCHQNPDKLICSGTGCSLLCARCIGIYTGVFISSLFMLINNYWKTADIKYFFASAVPLILDVIFVLFNIYAYSKLIAYSTGIIFGSVAFYYFYSGIENWFNEKKRLS